MGRMGKMWEERDRHGEDGRDMGRTGETWGGWERSGEDGRDVEIDVGRMGGMWGGWEGLGEDGRAVGEWERRGSHSHRCMQGLADPQIDAF